ncbi:beta/gamma crystallin domain-containing protein 1 [Melanotaenia boesemani]|uniref:beta/gamma crystallin domain-containing protein 1 n=1 Tax=Melanotaenia boesemani TaxID=1250792 RepID=UPI001C05C4DA|nr:beta/gamma crystallin domain-containing protein 1 [Melanotaenia boesemani]
MAKVFRKSLRTLFSRSDANLDESARAVKEEEADRTESEKKFRFLKLKKKKKKKKKTEFSSDWPVNEDQQEHRSAESRNPEEDEESDVTVKKSSSFFRIKSRAKDKHISFSELDLRKPRRFPMVSITLRKKKKNEENIWSSASSLHSSAHQDESPVHLGQVDLDQIRSKRQLSFSQPELDTSETFNIPSPPLVATNQSGSVFPLSYPTPGPTNTQPEPEGPLRAPIATIAELQLDQSSSSEDLSLQHKSFGPQTPRTQTSQKPDQFHPSGPQTLRTQTSQKPDQFHPSGPQTPMTQTSQKPDQFHPSGPQTLRTQTSQKPDQSNSLDLRAAVVQIICHDNSILQLPQDSPGNTHSDQNQQNRPSSQEISSVRDEQNQQNRLRNQDVVYGFMYESLFPQNFLSEITSSVLTCPPDATGAEPAPSRTLQFLVPPSAAVYAPSSSCSDGTKRFSAAAQLHRNLEIHSHGFPDSELKSGLVQDDMESGSLPAPPVSRTSRGTDAQVTISQHREVLNKQLLTDSSPAERKSAPTFPDIPTQMDGSDRPSSPPYLSVGSGDSSALEDYYSAQEDNAEDSRDEDMFMWDGGKETELQKQDPEKRWSRREERGTEEGTVNEEQQAGGQRSENQLQVHVGRAEEEEQEEDEGKKDELPAPPVQPVSRLMECDSAPPSIELQVKGEGFEGNQTPQPRDLCEERNQNLQARFLTAGDVRSPGDKWTRTIGQEAVAMATLGEEEEQLSLTEEEETTRKISTESVIERGNPSVSECIMTRSREEAGRNPTVSEWSSPEGAGPVGDRCSGKKLQGPDQPTVLDAETADGAEEPAHLDHRSLPVLSLHIMDFHLKQRDSGIPAESGSESDSKWKNRFEGVTQYKANQTESFLVSSSSGSVEHVTPGNSLSDSSVNLSLGRGAGVEPAGGGRRRSLLEEEPAAPSGEEDCWREGASERRDSGCNDDPSSRFSGVFRATLVELVSDPAASPSSRDTDSSNQLDMDSLVDTLKNMGPCLKPRTAGLRGPPPTLLSSLPPIVEDAPGPVTSDGAPSLGSPTNRMEESLERLYSLPADLGLKRSTLRDSRPPLDLMKKTKDLQSPVLNGNGPLPSLTTSSRLDSSVIFGGFRSPDQTLDNGKAHRPVFRTVSLPDTRPFSDRVSGSTKLGELGSGSDPAGSRLEHLSFLLSSSSSGSLTGAEDSGSTRMSRPPSLSIGSPPSSTSPHRLLSPTSSIDLHRPFTAELPMFGQGPGALQRSLSWDEAPVGIQTSLFGSMHGGRPAFQNQQPEPVQNLMYKYRAFPDAYLTKEKEHGKLNPRPGKLFIFDQPGMCGQRIEVHGDVIDATSWELQETASIRVIRGGWVLYEKPNFKGKKVALDEGDIELTCPFGPPEEQLQEQDQTGPEREARRRRRRPRNSSLDLFAEQSGFKKTGSKFGEFKEEQEVQSAFEGTEDRRDYSVPEISLFPEENAEGKKVIFRDTSEDARIFGLPVKANSIIINAGLWLVFGQPFFQGVPQVLEVGGYSNPAAWGVEQPYVGSLHPLKVGEPRVENMNEPKIVIYDKPYFSGKARTITSNMRDFMTRIDRQQTTFMYNVGSLKVLGGIWVGYEKEGFRGHQYLLEEGDYQDWRVWGGCDAELRSIRIIQADLTDPLMVMFEQPEEEEGLLEENTFEVTEAIPDVELYGYKTSTRSIHVLSGAWIAYSHVDFSGNQYILEKGFYNTCADWGSQDTRICSAQPILLAPSDTLSSRNRIILYSEPNFQGECHIVSRHQEELLDTFLSRSCRVAGGSWVLYEDKHFSGNLYVLSEGDYPSLTSMGCSPSCSIRSIRLVSVMFSVPSISLFSLEGLEGREITTNSEVLNLVQDGFNNHVLSVRVNSGCWVLCEHSNYRGRQFLLEPIEITNWPKFSSLHVIGSMYPIRQKRHFFRVRNKESGHFLSVQGGVEEMKSGRVVAAPEVEPQSDIWFYQDGLIKNKISPTMSLQVMGDVEPGAKVVLWTETRQPIQTWTAQMKGLISSQTFPGMVLDVKGGKTYDKDHVVVMPENDERPSQQWQMELL